MTCRKWIPRAAAFALLFLLVLVLAAKIYSVDRFPPIWDDESSFIMPAYSFARGEGLKTPIHSDFIPGIEKRTCWMPPLLFVAYSPFTRLWGYDVFGARWFIVFIFGLVFAGLVWMFRLLGEVEGSNARCFLSACLASIFVFAVSYGFLQSFPVFRMEPLVLLWEALGSVSYIAYLRKKKNGLLHVTALFSALSVLSHPMGVIFPAGVFLHFLVSEVRKEPEKVRALVVPIFIFTLVLLPWIIYAWKGYEDFIRQMSLQFGRKTSRYAGAFAYVKLAGRIFLRPHVMVVLLPAISFIAAKRSELQGKIALFLFLETVLHRSGVAYSSEMWYSVYDYFWLSVNMFFAFTALQGCEGGLRRALGVSMAIAFLLTVSRGFSYLKKNRDLILARREAESFYGEVGKVAGRFRAGDRVLVLGNPNYIVPFLERGVDVQVPRFVVKGTLGGENLRKYDALVFMANHSRVFSWTNRSFGALLSSDIRGRVEALWRGDKIFELGVLFIDSKR